MTYTIIVESSARADIDEGYEWMEENLTREAAAQWYFDIYSAIESLQTMPFRCGLARENAFFKEEIRQLICGKYRMLFEVDKNRVRVLHVRHVARQTLKPTKTKPSKKRYAIE